MNILVRIAVIVGCVRPGAKVPEQCSIKALQGDGSGYYVK